MRRASGLRDDVLRDLAIAEGACVRPVLSKVTDTLTAESRTVAVACGATRETVCPSCATRNRRLRMQQCREGWHLTDEPAREEPADQDETEDEEVQSRRVRSTRRRIDAPDLPRLPIDDRTVGRVFIAGNGKTYRPSMFVTLTLPSYGKVHTAATRPGQTVRCACGEQHEDATVAGTPIDPASYDYRRAALDALHFPKLIDRFWQNLRRAVGYNVQYFATVEPQHRLAAHLHTAIRGAIPRALLRQVAAATYHQVWWPHFDEPIYTDAGIPVWDEVANVYLDPNTREALPTWDETLDGIENDADAEPAHVLRFGQQVDMQGVLAGTPQADYAIGYLTKYLTKSITDPQIDGRSSTQDTHIDRLHAEVRVLPCSPTCANWLLYGVQPKDPRPGLEPGHCRSKAHDREHLGLGGRRVLVSRLWTGKTLTEHATDRAAVVRAVLAEAGVEMDNHDQYAKIATTPEGLPRYVWTPMRPGAPNTPSYLHVIAHAVRRRKRWREQYELAKQRAGPDPPNLSAIQA